MNSLFTKRILGFVILLGFVQIPLLHNWAIFGVAFPFPYVGLLLLLHHTLPKGTSMILAFFIGLIIDIFSSTPGLHASAAVLIVYVRLNWLGVITDLSNEELDISLNYLRSVGLALYLIPLIFLHHTMLFVLENEGFRNPGALFLRIFWSLVVTLSIIWLVELLLTPRKRRI